MPNVSDPNDPAWTPASGWEKILTFDNASDLDYIVRQPSSINPNTGTCCCYDVINGWLAPHRVYTGLYCRYPYNDACYAWYTYNVLQCALHFKVVGNIIGYWSGGYWWLIARLPLTLVYTYEPFYQNPSPYKSKLVIKGVTLYNIQEGVIHFDGLNQVIELYDSSGNLVISKPVSDRFINVLFSLTAKYVSTLGGAGSTYVTIDWVAWNNTPPKPPSNLEFAMPSKILIYREGQEDNPIIDIRNSTPLIYFSPGDDRIHYAKVYVEVEGKRMSNTHIMDAGEKRVMLEIETDKVYMSESNLILDLSIAGFGSTNLLSLNQNNCYLVITKSSAPHYLNFQDYSGNKLFEDVAIDMDRNGDGYYESAIVLVPQTSGYLSVYVEAFDGTSSVNVYVIEVPKEYLIDANIVVEEQP